MKRMLALILCLAVTTVAGHFSAASAQSKMITFQLVLLKKGTTLLDAKTLEAHRAHVMKLGTEGTGVVAGPFTDGGDIAGALILRAPTPERAQEILVDDPAVKAGMFTVEVLPFMSTDEGQFQKWPRGNTQETVYFGFLNSGPNRSHDKETAQQLQKEHLAYMGSQANEGKLIVAGPFVNGGTRRGIVIYRVGSPDEAKMRAEADPMIKAGRLAVVLHPWSIPKGTLR